MLYYKRWQWPPIYNERLLLLVHVVVRTCMHADQINRMVSPPSFQELPPPLDAWNGSQVMPPVFCDHYHDIDVTVMGAVYRWKLNGAAGHHTLQYGPSIADEFNLCRIPRYYTFPALEQLLPPSNGIFVAEFIEGVVCLLVYMVLLTGSMYLVHIIWNKIDERFSSITLSHKKWYVVANLSKAFLLGVLALSVKYWWTLYVTYYKARRHVTRLELKRCTVL